MPSFDAECKNISGGADNGFLSAAKIYFGNPPESNNNTQAISNMNSCAQGNRRRSMFIGHGLPGRSNTGSGDHGGTSEQYIASWNRPKWLERMKFLDERCLSLVFCSCDVGAEDVGADLLYYVATAIHSVVSGPTYLVWAKLPSGPVYLDPKAEWQTAYPGIRPEPKSLPTFVMTEKLSLIRAMVGTLMEDIFLHSVVEVRVVRDDADFALQGAAARDFLETFPLSFPEVVDAVPAAIVTARIFILAMSSIGEVLLRFNVYNDHLIQDDVHRNVFYRGSAEFRASITSSPGAS
jgi:hypothetical protein